MQSIDCERVTVYGSVSAQKDDGVIDWLALANQAELGTGEIESHDGCLIDTDGVGANEIVTSALEGAAIADDIDGEVKIHQLGTKFRGERDHGSTLQSEKAHTENVSFLEAINKLPTFVIILLTLVPLGAAAAILRYIAITVKSATNTSGRRFTCRIPAEITVSGRTIDGRIMRFGPNTCNFVPNSESDADMIAGILMKSAVPDFDLNVGPMSLPIIPDTPGSRFTVLFFVNPLSPEQIETLKGLSLTGVRIEKQSTPPKRSAHRETLRASRLRRMQSSPT